MLTQGAYLRDQKIQLLSPRSRALCGWKWSRNPIRRAEPAQVVSERNTSRTCSSCGSLSGPHGVNGLRVRRWVCGDCGESHDRDVTAARNILRRAELPASVCGNESSIVRAPPSRATRSCKA